MRASYTHGPSPVSTGVQRRSHLLCKSSIMPKNKLVKGKRTGYTEMQQDSHYLTLRPRKRAKNCKGPKTGRTTPARRWPSAHPLDFDCKTLHFPAKARKRARGEVSEGGAAQPRAARPLTFYPCWPPPPGYQPTARAQRANGYRRPRPAGQPGTRPGAGAPSRNDQQHRADPRAEGTERANGSGPGARRRRTAAYVAAQGARALPPHRRGRQGGHPGGDTFKTNHQRGATQLPRQGTDRPLLAPEGAREAAEGTSKREGRRGAQRARQSPGKRPQTHQKGGENRV